MPRTKSVPVPATIETIVGEAIAKIRHDTTAAVNLAFYNAFSEVMQNGETPTRRKRRARRTTRRRAKS